MTITTTTTDGPARQWAEAVHAAPGLPAGARLVALALAEHADADGRHVTITRDALAAAAHVSHATTKRSVRRLREYGFLRDVRPGVLALTDPAVDRWVRPAVTATRPA